MPNPKVALVGAITGAALALPGAASAQIDPGVTYDPGSPAGKEYAIPLVEGRSDAAGTTDQQKGASIPFGVGIKPPGGNGGGKPGAGDETAAENASRRGNGSGRGRQEPLPGARARESTDAL